jgi:ADP-ribose pyrophosphatase YjhB (NUDIX family)
MEKHFYGQIAQKAILKYNKSFVLVKEKTQDEWILPGGRLNVLETAEEGLIREIKEELGIDCKIHNIIALDAYNSNNKKRKSKLFVFYYASVLPRQKITIANEISEVIFISKKEELKNLKMFENQKKIIKDFLK